MIGINYPEIKELFIEKYKNSIIFEDKTIMMINTMNILNYGVKLSMKYIIMN